MGRDKPNRLVSLYYRATLYLRPMALIPTLITFLLAEKLASRYNPKTAALIGVLFSQRYYSFMHHPRVAEAIVNRLFALAKTVPAVQRTLDKDLGPVLKDLEESEFKHRKGDFRYLKLPDTGISQESILSYLGGAIEQDGVDLGKLSGALYTKERDFHKKLYANTALRNPMHADLWPALQDTENQAVEMALRLYHAPAEGWGQMTGGGTLSILTACMAYRNRALDYTLPVTSPNMIISDRAHPAFRKACEVLGIQCITVPSDPLTHQVDVGRMKAAITPNTILLVASAPAFPEGIMDDVQAVSTLALRYGIGCHVDACLGGFIIPFCAEAGVELPPFDFKLPGVTSVSADNHKYGLSEKGHSTIMFESFDALGKYSTFTDLDSTIGIYASLGLEGSRPSRTNAWALMIATGRKGYVDNLREMLAIKNAIVDAVTDIAGLHIAGTPLLPIIAIRSDDNNALNSLLVASLMAEKGWALNGLPSPPGFHFCITPAHIKNPKEAENGGSEALEAGTAATFVRDLKDAVLKAKEDPKAKPRGTLGMYELLRNKVPPGVGGPVREEIGRGYLGILASARPKLTGKK